jgi:hypothetical protein
MKRQAAAVVLLYFLALITLTWPVILAAFWPAWSVDESRRVFSESLYWSFVAVMVAGQAALLVLPVKVASRRPTTRRSLLWPIAVSGLMMGGFVIGAICAVAELFQRDDAFNSSWIGWSAIGAGTLMWAGWTIVFYRMSRSAEAKDVVSRQCRLLLRGSFLELLVAVPTHIVARGRDYCCAGAYTFIGIALGLTVMLLSFGPGVFLLFVDRWRQIRPRG